MCVLLMSRVRIAGVNFKNKQLLLEMISLPVSDCMSAVSIARYCECVETLQLIDIPSHTNSSTNALVAKLAQKPPLLLSVTCSAFLLLLLLLHRELTTMR